MSLQEDLERNQPRAALGAALDRCGHYLLKAELASGSMGVVYLAEHELTRAEVALKLLRPELMGRAESRDRFLREVSAASRIGHAGVVQVLDAGVDEHGRFFIAMEHLRGDDFCNRLACGGLTIHEALRYIDDLLDPLIAAHDVGLVHRDLKPENVFILDAPGPTRVKLLDFGIVRELDQKSATATGLVVGTPAYMSPEQALKPRSVSPATDVWAVGVMLYEVLTGRVPFDGESAHAVVVHACNDPHVPVHALVPSVDRRLSALVDRCLSKQPGERPADARALKRELSVLLRTSDLNVALRPRVAPLPPLANTPSDPEATMRTDLPVRNRNTSRWRWGLTAAMAGLLAVAGVWGASRGKAPTAARKAAPAYRSPPPLSVAPVKPKPLTSGAASAPYNVAAASPMTAPALSASSRGRTKRKAEKQLSMPDEARAEAPPTETGIREDLPAPEMPPGVVTAQAAPAAGASDVPTQGQSAPAEPAPELAEIIEPKPPVPSASIKKPETKPPAKAATPEPLRPAFVTF